MVVTLGRGGSEEYIISDEDPRRHRGDGVMQLYEVEYIDNVGGVGGTVKFYLDGIQVGAAKPANVKPRISNTVPFEVNATASNTNDSVDGLEVEYVTIDFDRPGVASTYEAVVSGPIQASDLEALVVDASGYTAAVPEQHVTYTANTASGPQTTDLTVVVGPMQVPAGRAYKAVLEDWSSGVGVAHPNELIMTKPAAQNCRFEDVTLFGSQPSWMEVLPQGAVPTIGGISYYWHSDGQLCPVPVRLRLGQRDHARKSVRRSDEQRQLHDPAQMDDLRFCGHLVGPDRAAQRPAS
jgi:hypothetical protein